MGATGMVLLALLPAYYWAASLSDSDGRVLQPSCLEVVGPSRQVFVGFVNADHVAVVEDSSGRILDCIPVGGGVSDLAYRPGLDRVYAAVPNLDAVVTIDVATHSVVSTVPVGDEPVALEQDDWLKLYCACRGSGEVVVLRQDRDSVIKRVRTGPAPTALVLEPVRRRVFCLNAGLSTVSAIDINTDSVVAQAFVGPGPTALACPEFGNLLYCANTGDRTLTAIDKQTCQAVGEVMVGDQPVALALDPVHRQLFYCVCRGSRSVSVIDAIGNYVVSVSFFDGDVVAVAPSLGGGNFACALFDRDQVVQANGMPVWWPDELSGSAAVSDLSAYAYIPVASLGNVAGLRADADMPERLLGHCRSPREVLVNPQSDVLYCAGAGELAAVDCRSGRLIRKERVPLDPVWSCYNPRRNKTYFVSALGQVVIVDGATHTVRTVVPVGRSPARVVYSPLADKVYCTNQHGNSVTVIDGDGDSVLTTIPINTGPYGICTDPEGRFAYVGNFGNATVSVINCLGDSIIRLVSVGNGPVDLCYDSVHRTVYCANFHSHSVSVFGADSARVMTTIPVGMFPRHLLPLGDRGRVLCSNQGVYPSTDSTVSVIDTDEQREVARAVVGHQPGRLTFDRSRGTVLCALPHVFAEIDAIGGSLQRTLQFKAGPSLMVVNRDLSALYILCDLSGTIVRRYPDYVGVEQTPQVMARLRSPATIINRGVITLAGRGQAVLVDACGRMVTGLGPGENDVSRLGPGVYFVRMGSRDQGVEGSSQKVVITR